MLDINFIRDNQDTVKKAAENKQLNPKIVDEVLRYDDQRRKLILEVESLRAKRNEINEKIKKFQQSKSPEFQKLVKESVELKKKLQDVEPQLKKVEEAFSNLMLQVPNVPASDVPIGIDESGNKVLRQEGKKPKFDFEPKEHYELAEALDLYDSKRAVRIAGSRAYFLKNEMVEMEQAVLRFALELISKEGFTPMTVPWMVNREALEGTGYFPWGEDDHYKTQDGQGLIGTAEVALTAYHMGETLSYKDLPVKLCGISPCFRREVGSYGKDTKGFFRIHQFNKVEMVVMSVADEADSRQWHEKMLAISEKLLNNLGLPYQILLMCSGDMGAGQRKKYDVETWFPGQNKYRETNSDSYFLDFQARRLNTKYKDKDGQTKFVYTLNNTVAATPRLLAAILENYQQKDGSVKVPQVLQKYVGFKVIKR